MAFRVDGAKTEGGGLITLFERLKRAGLPLDIVYDIGACIGSWTKQIKTELPDARFVMFEANPAWEQTLVQTGLGDVVMACLSNPGRTFADFYNGTNTGDSYYKERTSYYENQGSIPLPCVTLEEVASARNLPPPDVIKLDTQGSELDIIEGAGSLFANASVVQCEVPFISYNDGAPSLAQYLDVFRKSDFLPVRLVEATILEEVLIHADIVFVRRDVKDKYLSPTRNLWI